jgi:hypothetical protein
MASFEIINTGNKKSMPCTSNGEANGRTAKASIARTDGKIGGGFDAKNGFGPP